MAQFLVLCLILTDAFVISSTANNVKPSVNPPASSPSNKVEGVAEVPAARRLGKHQHGVVSLAAAPSLTPLEAPQAEENVPSSKEGSSSSLESTESGQVLDMEVVHHHHHSALDNSSAGGGVILGGLATTFLVAIICYIRATRRKNAEPNAQL